MSLERYSAARDDALHLLDDIQTTLAAEAVWWNGKDAALASLRDDAARMRERPFVVAIVGEFSSGKSFLLNALLGRVALEERMGTTRITGLLATDINPSTAAITELTYAEQDRATAIYENGREERIPLDRLARFVAVGDEAKLHDATSDERSAPVRVRVEIDSPFLAGGFIVADTPGLASINPAHRRATLRYLPGADAVLYLIDTQQPFTEGDAAFLGIVRRYLESIFIVQTKIDLWRATVSASDGEPAESWRIAYARIRDRAAEYAPGTPVFPLSAREYAEGLLTGSEALVEQSRFPVFRSALDASLVATAGRARLARLAASADRVADEAGNAIDALVAALERSEAQSRSDREELVPVLAALYREREEARARVLAERDAFVATLGATTDELQSELRASLARAFDITDIARLRDRAKLHILVDEIVAAGVGRFADTASAEVARRFATAASGTALSAVEFAAPRFDAEPGSGMWSQDLESGVRSAIVLGALAGPAVGLVTAIAARFASAPPGGYMKRELQADLATTLFAQFAAEIASFTGSIIDRLRGAMDDLGAALDTRFEASRRSRIETFERALDIVTHGAAETMRADLVRRSALLREHRSQLQTILARFEEESAEDRAVLDQAVLPAGAPVAARTLSEFDAQTYEHGLRPQRWRVVILGAFHRGKSALINAIAGTTVLRDEGEPAGFTFPVHVRYGPELRAYALGEDAVWNAVSLEDTHEAAQRAPVLIEIPWSLPRELVLVHAPAFDAGDAHTEPIVLAAASAASETLALFSRQLSDRELDLYERVAKRGGPVSLVHTLADHESADERRHVVTLADRYARERGIVPQRTYTVSALDYREARARGAAPAGWNELGALIDTLRAHAEEHMARIEQRERDRAAQERLVAPRPARAEKTPLFSRLFGKRA